MTDASDPAGPVADVAPRLSYRTPPSVVVLALLFFVACSFVVGLSWSGIATAQPSDFMIFVVTSFFPVAMLIVSVFRLLSLSSRHVVLEHQRLLHHQLFKNYKVPLQRITRIEASLDTDEEIDTIKILWSGTPFYVDNQAIDDFAGFVKALRKRASHADFVIVGEFSPS